MNKLVVRNDISQLTLDSEEFNKVIWKSLRFRDKNYYFHPRYNPRKGWDGFVEFYSDKTGKFATGILPEVVRALSSLKIKLEIEDERSGIIPIKEIKEDIFPGVTLRDYQVDIANKAWKLERGIIKAATGSGKTLTFCSIVKSIPENAPALILFRSKTLVDQTYKVFKKNGIENVGRIHGDVWEPSSILCTTIQSAHNYEELLDKFRVLICDECHEFATNQSIKLFKKMKRCRYRFGFSATPWEKGDDVRKYRLKSWFGPIIGDISVKELQDKGILADSVCYFHKIKEPVLESFSYRDSYDAGIVYNEHFHNKVKEISDSYQKGRILIIVDRIDHGEELKKIIPGAFWIQGKDDNETRQIVIDKLCKSDPNEKVVAIATRIISVGVDVFIHALINAAGLKSQIATIQRLGRGLRRAEDKDTLDYHDFDFTIDSYLENHSKLRMKHLKQEGHKIVRMD
jgi:superfamily II DNA or RNA helicase